MAVVQYTKNVHGRKAGEIVEYPEVFVTQLVKEGSVVILKKREEFVQGELSATSSVKQSVETQGKKITKDL